METFYFLNKSTGEILELKFREFENVERFLETSPHFELIEGSVEQLPVRGTRKID
tara:strand:- start:67 stop:231 length:165 start_codon:yes stop_codon:yes gene_type:complete